MPPKKVYVKKTKKTYKKARGGPSAIATLTKRVNALTRATQGTQSKIMYGQKASVTLGNASGNFISVVPMLKFSNWARIFGTDADDEQGKRCVVKSSNFQWNIITNEPDPIGYSMFCVSLKKSASDLITSAGDLATLISDTHFAGAGSKVLLNMNYFNVHYVKRFVTGANRIERAVAGQFPAIQTAPSETQSLQKTGKFSVPYGKYGMTIINPAGDWKAGGHPKGDTQNYFFLTFCDNATVDFENPVMEHNIVHSVLVSA